MNHLTTPRLLALLATLALLLVAAPVATATAKCVSDKGFGRVCYERGETTCAWATQFDAATDFGTIEKQCLTLRQEGGTVVVCAQTVAGAGTYSGFYGVAATECAAAYPWNDTLCAVAWGELNQASWQMSDHVCLPLEPIPLLA